MKTDVKEMKYLKDFKNLDCSTPEMNIEFVLGKKKTEVITTYKVQNLSGVDSVFFDGVNLDFKSVKINGAELAEKSYELNNEGILIKEIPQKNFELVFENTIYPEKNTDLEGLYLSGDMLCTQNEPMGFRKITYAIDRPDNMVKCQVILKGSKKEFPFMLANGNLVKEKSEGDITVNYWEDPFPKPLYLFALVAGDLAEITDSYTTKSGKKVDIKFYCDHGAESKCDFAIESLKKSMKWDEDRFGLEYDLDLYMVVAVDSFNMGAMENKGLNIFNSALVLADPQSATDMNYHRIESVIGHEYFHNWTGNRVTLKNWFQLTLKEGLTVFRDQEFSSDLNDRSVERIDMVKMLKDRQFVEDASPLAHPIRPEKYKEMNNFYTATVYEKGAEVIRMIHTILGEEKFQKGMKDYFKKYDGQAITTEDFLQTMAAQDKDFDSETFAHWYKTPGTPHVLIKEIYDQDSKSLKIQFTQKNETAKKQNLGFDVTYIPIKMSIYTGDGDKLNLNSIAAKQPYLNKGLFVLSEKEAVLELQDIPEGYVCSYFENFSAPVTYEVEGNRNLSVLVKYDKDNFNRYFSLKESALLFVKNQNEAHIDSVKYILEDESISNLMKSHLLAPPVFSDFTEGLESYDPSEITKLQQTYTQKIGDALGTDFINFIQNNKFKKYEYTLEQRGVRALIPTVLEYVAASTKYKTEAKNLIADIYKNSDNMTLRAAAFLLMTTHLTEDSAEISQDLYEQSKDDLLMLQKWVSTYVQAPSFAVAKERIDKIQKLEQYTDKIPNFVRALWGGFYRNEAAFHDKSGEGYQLLLDAVARIDGINPQMSSALMRAFSFAPRLEGENGKKVKDALEEFGKKHKNLSSNLSETYDSILSAI